MSRLTKKDLAIYSGRISGKTLFDKVYNKLGELEDIEDELGCPIDVVFKALLNGIWLSNGIYEFIHDLEIGDFGLDTISNCIFNYSENDYVFLKDYKKTWWLSSDLEEKEND